MNERIKYLESKLPKGLDYEGKYYNNFSKYACYMGNGVYTWKGIHATDTRELFLMGVLSSEKIKFKEV
jgi:hypothetical protein